MYGTDYKFSWSLSQRVSVCLSVVYDLLCRVNTCAVARECESHFGDIDVIQLSTEVSSPVRPSEMIDRASVRDLGREQQAKLLAVAKLLSHSHGSISLSIFSTKWHRNKK